MAGPLKDVILAIDEGTSGTRAATVSADGDVSCLEYLPLEVDTPRPGVVEQDANAILEKTVAACRATIAQASQNGLRIVAMAIATQRATAVLWDTTTGRALVPAMVWQDTRYVGELNRLAPVWDPILARQVGRAVCARPICGLRGIFGKHRRSRKHLLRSDWGSVRSIPGCCGI